jgi:hypothetical protein
MNRYRIIGTFATAALATSLLAGSAFLVPSLH